MQYNNLTQISISKNARDKTSQRFVTEDTLIYNNFENTLNLHLGL